MSGLRGLKGYRGNIDRLPITDYGLRGLKRIKGLQGLQGLHRPITDYGLPITDYREDWTGPLPFPGRSVRLLTDAPGFGTSALQAFSCAGWRDTQGVAPGFVTSALQAFGLWDSE